MDNIINDTPNTQKTYKQTKKHKNTYIVQYQTDRETPTFIGCKTAPIRVFKKNGEIINRLVFFKNPELAKFIIKYTKLCENYGKTKACTIVEYLDKKTGLPVIVQFADETVSLVPGKKWYTVANTQLNHATRADLYRIQNKYKLR